MAGWQAILTGAPVKAIGDALDSVFTSDEERLDKQAVLDGIRTSPHLLALQISMEEAKSKDKWTSRARPMVLYAFCLVFVIQNGVLPVLWWAMQAFIDPTIPPPPAVLSMDMVMMIVSGVLGTSWIAGRSVEKIKGRAK